MCIFVFNLRFPLPVKCVVFFNGAPADLGLSSVLELAAGLMEVRNMVDLTLNILAPPHSTSPQNKPLPRNTSPSHSPPPNGPAYVQLV